MKERSKLCIFCVIVVLSLATSLLFWEFLGYGLAYGETNKKCVSTYSLNLNNAQEKLIDYLEKVPLNKWEKTSTNTLQFSNKGKEVDIAIDGTVRIEYRTLKFSPKSRERIVSLYKKLDCLVEDPDLKVIIDFLRK